MDSFGVSAPAAALGVLTAMITPAVLISACGLLVLSTATRLGRVLDRVRQLPERMAELDRRRDQVSFYAERRAIIFEQMDALARRGRLLQLGLTLFHLGIATFVATSVAVGIVGIAAPWAAWTPVLMAFAGAMMLLLASLLLIAESRLALRSTLSEMALVRRLGEDRHDGGHGHNS